MPLITDIRPQKKRQDRVNIFIDGSYAFALDQLSAHEARLVVGEELSDERLTELMDKAGLDSALSVALRYLSARPRSERELRTRLRQRKIGEAVIDRTVEQLKAEGCLTTSPSPNTGSTSESPSDPAAAGCWRWNSVRRASTARPLKT